MYYMFLGCRVGATRRSGWRHRPPSAHYHGWKEVAGP